MDFRLQPALYRHPKFLRLLNELGDKGAICLHRLWAFAAESRPTGLLDGLETGDIALAAGWSDDPEKFVEVLIKLRWLDRRGDTLELHGWVDNQPWVIHAPERSEHARRAAHGRWKKNAPHQSEHCSEDAQSMPAAFSEDARRNAPSPSPTPNPSPKERKSRSQARSKKPDFEVWFGSEFEPNYPEPRRVQRKTAIAELRKIKPDAAARVAIMGRLAAWKLSTAWTKDNGDYIPGMGKFFGEGYYERDPIEPAILNVHGAQPNGHRPVFSSQVADHKEILARDRGQGVA
jgi:hypothetical protein